MSEAPPPGPWMFKAVFEPVLAAANDVVSALACPTLFVVIAVFGFVEGVSDFSVPTISLCWFVLAGCALIAAAITKQKS